MDLAKIRKLIEFVGSSQISELSVTEHGVSVRITREQGGAAEMQPPAHVDQGEPTLTTALHAPSTENVETVMTAATQTTISAPSFGIFHRAPSPGAPPFVEIGDEIVKGQDLFIVEAMKVFNTVRAEQGGKVVKILAQDGADVDLGQPVLEIA